MMTDREKLIELIYRAHHNASCVIAHDGSEEEAVEEEARYLIANGVTFATDTNVLGELSGNSELFKWISVEDKMPHAEYGESDNVLAVDGHGIVEMLYFDGGCWRYPIGEPVFYENPSWRITHWMPLPEPPKVQEVTNGTDHV